MQERDRDAVEATGSDVKNVGLKAVCEGDCVCEGVSGRIEEMRW